MGHNSKYSFIPLYLSISAAALAITLFFYIYASIGYRNLVRSEAESRVAFQERMLETYLSEVAGDCLFLAETPLVGEFVGGRDADELKRALELLLTSKPRYESITFFDSSGTAAAHVTRNPEPNSGVEKLPVTRLQRLRILDTRDLQITMEGRGSAALWREPLDSPLIHFWMPVITAKGNLERYFLRITVDFDALARLLYTDNGEGGYSYFLFSSEGKVVAFGDDYYLPPASSLQGLVRSEKTSRWIEGSLIAGRRFGFSSLREIGEINVIADIYTLITVYPDGVRAVAMRSLLFDHLAWLAVALMGVLPLSLLFTGYRRRQEEAETLLDENIRFQSAVMQTLPDTILRIDREGGVESVQTNPDSFRMFRHQDFPARVEDIFPEELAYKIGYFVDQTLNRGRESWFEYRFEERGGDFFFDFRFVCSGEGEVILILRNKTEEREQQRRLYTTNLFLDAYKSAMDASSLVAKTDRQGRLIYMNEHFRTRFGRSYSHAVGRDLIELMNPRARESAAAHRSDALDRLMVLSGIIECRGIGGETFYIDNTLLPISDEAGRVQEVISFGHDVTELENALAVAREAENTRSTFIARMSHEMRTPLNCIIGFSEVVSEADDIDMAHRYGRMILGESETLLDLVNQVLDLSKIEAGKLAIQMQPFDLYSLLSSTVESNIVLARKKGLTMRLIRPEQVPRFLIGDPVRLRQVLNNLLGNAVKFTDSGGVELVLAAQSVSSGSCQLRFEIRDTGIGIPYDQQAHVFDSFFQVDAGDTRRYGGTGLGTTIARQLVELMGGEIAFESDPGEGSRFWFVIDLEESTVLPENREQDGGSAELALDLSDVTILIAEDYQPNLELLRLFLDSTGARLIGVENGSEAVAAFERGGVDCILMDIHMPVLDGYEATKEIRRLEEDGRSAVPIIGVTANAFRKDMNRCIEAGMDRVLIKPLRRRKLLSTLAVALGRTLAESDAVPARTNAADAEVPMGFVELLAELDGDRQAARQLADGFVDELERRIPVIEAARAGGDWSLLHREVHSIKGGAANLFAPGLHASALRLERAAKAGNGEACTAAIKPFLEEARLLIDYLRDGAAVSGSPRDGTE